MRSVIISSVLLIIVVIAIAMNSYYINSVSTELLDIIFTLPSEYNYIINLDEMELEKYKSEINKIETEWEKNSQRFCLVTRYSDFERTNSSVHSLKEYFFAENYSEYLATRKKLISALEKQKHNELPNFENIL